MARNQHKVQRLTALGFIKGHFGKVFAETVLQLVLRIVALLPLFAAVKGVKLPGIGEYSALVLGVISAALYLLVVMPLRYRATQMIWYVNERSKCAYKTALQAAMRRVCVGLLWGLPFILSAGLWFYAFNGMDMPTFFKILTTLGGIVGGRFDAGIVLWVGGILVFALLFAYGWWYNMPKDYVYLGKDYGAALKKAGKMRAKNGGKYAMNAVGNMILTLPSIAIVLYVVGMHYVGSIDLSMGAMAAAQQLMNILKQSLPTQTLLQLCAALLLVHVPLCVWRKTRNAVLTYKLMAEGEKD